MLATLLDYNTYAQIDKNHVFHIVTRTFMDVNHTIRSATNRTIDRKCPIIFLATKMADKEDEDVISAI